MIHKNRCNRRWVRKKQMRRKAELITQWGGATPVGVVRGRLAKGKVHCDCAMCAVNSTKMRRSRYGGYISYNSPNWYKVSDKRKLDECTESVNEYLTQDTVAETEEIADAV